MFHRYRKLSPLFVAGVAALVVATLTVTAAAQSAATDPPVNALATKQQMILDRLARLEDHMFRLREKLSQTEPENARKLGEALRRSGELNLKARVEALSESLRAADQLATTAEEQDRLIADLQAVLNVLLDRDPDDARRREELDRLAEVKKNLDRVIQEQNEQRQQATDAVRAQRLGAQIEAAIRRLDSLLEQQQQLSGKSAESQEPSAENAEQQSKLAEDAKRLAEDVEKMERPADGENPKDPGAQNLDEASKELESGAEDMKHAAEKMAESNPDAKDKQAEALDKLERARHKLEEARKALEKKIEPSAAAEKQRKLGEETGKLAEDMKGKPGQQSPQGERQDDPQPGDPQPSEPPSGEPQPPDPGQQNVERAQKHMEKSADKLDESDTEKAILEQDQAIDELQRAQLELEEALKQLRAEEQEEILRGLETRLSEMLAKQTDINTESLVLHERGEDNFTRAETLKCAELADRQTTLATSADTCVRLLEEDGTTVVFPQIMGQVAADMREIAQRLADTAVGPFTIGAQNDVRGRIEELLQALEKLREKRDQQQQAGGGAGGGGAGINPPLVPTSAELKMLKSSQRWINTHTATAQAARDQKTESADDITTLLQRAAQRQAEVAKMAREIQQRAEKEHTP